MARGPYKQKKHRGSTLKGERTSTSSLKKRTRGACCSCPLPPQRVVVVVWVGTHCQLWVGTHTPREPKPGTTSSPASAGSLEVRLGRSPLVGDGFPDHTRKTTPRSSKDQTKGDPALAGQSSRGSQSRPQALAGRRKDQQATSTKPATNRRHQPNQPMQEHPRTCRVAGARATTEPTTKLTSKPTHHPAASPPPSKLLFCCCCCCIYPD